MLTSTAHPNRPLTRCLRNDTRLPGWDGQDFKVLYKPLYDCSQEGGIDLRDRFEGVN